MLAPWALVALALGSEGCRRHAVRRPPRRGAVTVERVGAGHDPGAEAAARELDARLGGACPRRITLTAGASAERDRSETASACVDAALRGANVPRARAEPWRTAMIELLTLPPDGATAAARRSLARELVARGAGKHTLGAATAAPLTTRTTRTTLTTLTIEDRSPPDPRATAAVAFAFLEVLAARPAYGLLGALRFVTRLPAHGVDGALAAARSVPGAPNELDAETLLSVARAALLARQVTPGPALVEARWDDAASRVVARFDRPLLLGTVAEARVCDEPVRESNRPSPTELAFALDRARLAGCPVVDGVVVVRVSVGEAPWTAPYAASDGALAKPAHARVVLP